MTAKHQSRIAIIGAGGGSRDVADIVDACQFAGMPYVMLGYITDPQFVAPGIILNDKPVLGGFDWLAEHHAYIDVLCGVGAPEIRRKLVLRAAAVDANFCTLIHPSVLKTRWVDAGIGSSIGAGCILTNQIKIGDHVQINIGCTLSHDTIVEDYVTLSPGVHLAGNVIVEEGCFIGMGVSCIEKRRIGAWSIIGAGAVIIDDVPPNSTVVGVPGKVIKTRLEGWHLS